MSEESDSLIAKAQEKLRGLEEEVIKTKEFINQLREFEGEPPLYTDIAVPQDVSLGSIRSDQFYGRPLATVIREILEARQLAGQGAISVKELYSTLCEGGYAFETNSEENAKRGLRISLSKNQAFHKIPNSGDYGLNEWYPSALKKRARASANGMEEENGSVESDQDALEESSEELVAMKPR